MLVSVSDLSKYMDIRFNNGQEEAAEFVLEGLQSELEAYLRRPIEPTAVVEKYILESNYVGVPMSSFFTNETSMSADYVGTITYAQPPQTLYLRNSPVVSVTFVKLRQQTANSQTTLTVGLDYVVRRYGIDIFRGYANDEIEVSYTAGLAGTGIKVFKLMILRAATREMQNMHDDVVGIKDLETRNVAPLEVGFLEKELISIKRYRRSRVA